VEGGGRGGCSGRGLYQGLWVVCGYQGRRKGWRGVAEGGKDVVCDLVYLTLGHLRRPGQVQVPKGGGENR
jgi:hypothetical protein